MWTQPDRECPVPRTDEDVRCCNGSPILEACASDEIHSAVSHNSNTLDGCFQLLVRKKHWPWAHVGGISTLRSSTAELRHLSFANNRSGKNLLRSNAFIPVMEAAELWN